MAETAQKRQQSAGNSENQGAGTAKRSDARRSQAAPTEPPTQPAYRNPDYVATSSRLRSLSGQEHGELLGEDGEKLDPDKAFDLGEGHRTYAVTTQRVHERYFQPGANQATTRLLFPAGYRIPRADVDAIKAAVSQ